MGLISFEATFPIYQQWILLADEFHYIDHSRWQCSRSTSLAEANVLAKVGG